MSFGDINTYSIPAVYKGIQMRSKLETKVALFLDYLKIKWEYEPKTFYLSNGIAYKPDFFLPEHKQWIEVKGVIGKNNLEISECFVKDTQQELILISAKEIYYYEMWNNGGVWPQEGMQIGYCSNCKTHFFCTHLGCFHCRKCGTHEGDHDIIAAINPIDGFWGEDVNFSDVNSIKQWLGDHGTRV